MKKRIFFKTNVLDFVEDTDTASPNADDNNETNKQITKTQTTK